VKRSARPSFKQPSQRGSFACRPCRSGDGPRQQLGGVAGAPPSSSPSRGLHAEELERRRRLAAGVELAVGLGAIRGIQAPRPRQPASASPWALGKKRSSRPRLWSGLAGAAQASSRAMRFMGVLSGKGGASFTREWSEPTAPKTGTWTVQKNCARREPTACEPSSCTTVENPMSSSPSGSFCRRSLTRIFQDVQFQKKFRLLVTAPGTFQPMCAVRTRATPCTFNERSSKPTAMVRQSWEAS